MKTAPPICHSPIHTHTQSWLRFDNQLLGNNGWYVDGLSNTNEAVDSIWIAQEILEQTSELAAISLLCQVNSYNNIFIEPNANNVGKLAVFTDTTGWFIKWKQKTLTTTAHIILMLANSEVWSKTTRLGIVLLVLQSKSWSAEWNKTEQ